MDEPDLDPDLQRDALVGLERINVLSRTVSSIWGPIRSAFRGARRPFTILDAACGAGDLVVGLALRARQLGMSASVHGCDISHTAVAHARARAVGQRVDATFFQCDLFGDPFRQHQFDVVTCSLFLHHLDERAAVRLLQIMKRAARSLVIVSDLNRTALGTILAWLGPRVLTRSPVVHVDSIRSVRAAFTSSEARTLCVKAGLAPYTITTIWPCRWRLVAAVDR